MLVTSQHGNQSALDGKLVGGNENRFHPSVGGLQADAPVGFAVKSFQRCFGATDERDDDLPLGSVRCFFNEDEIALQDVFFDHGIALNLQNINIFLAGEIGQG